MFHKRWVFRGALVFHKHILLKRVLGDNFVLLVFLSLSNNRILDLFKLKVLNFACYKLQPNEMMVLVCE